MHGKSGFAKGMTMKETNIKYTATDFERYHSGAMPPDEMHALEKAALEDSFLSDALEGYINTPDFKVDILELKARLKEKKRKKNVFSISSIAQNKWWRIAAILMIIAGVGFLFSKTNFVAKEDSLATNKIKPVEKKPDTIALLKDSVMANGNVVFQNPSASAFPQKTKRELSNRKKENPAPILNNSMEANDDIAFEKPKASQYSKQQIPSSLKLDTTSNKENFSPEAKIESKTVTASASELKDISAVNDTAIGNKAIAFNKKSKTQFLFKGTIVDEAGTPVAFVTVTETGTRNATTADANGHFILQSPDSIIFATATATGFDQKKFITQKNLASAVTLARNSQELTTVTITTALGTRREKSIQKNKITKPKKIKVKASRLVMPDSEIQPFQKNENFDEYLKEILVPLFDSNNKQITGEVVLAFTINKKGRPGNIKIIKSSCDACEKLAIRLLENGPAWKEERNTAGTLVIKF